MTSTHQLPARIQAKIAVADDGCWNWTGTLQSRGYGCTSHRGRRVLSHRFVYEALREPIPEGLQIDHLCQNKRCCNPAHLEVVTGVVNMSRTAQATKTHCVHGHEYTPENTRIKKRKNGLTIRNCRTCELAAKRRYYLRNLSVPERISA